MYNYGQILGFKMDKKDKKLSNSAKPALAKVFFQLNTGAYTLRARTGSYCLFQDPPENFWHFHEFFEVCLVLSGHGKHHLEKTEINVGPGDIFIADPGVFHLISSYESKDLYLAFFSMEIIKNINEHQESKIDFIISNFLKSHKLVSHQNQIQFQYLNLLDANRTNLDVGCLDQILLTWILETMSSLTVQKTEIKSEALDTKHKKLQKALEYIEARLQNEIMISEIAEVMSVSERSSRRIFQELTGKSIVTVINEQKMKYVAHLLHQNYTLTQCADKMNNMSTSQLSKMFKKITGLSPKDYKTSLQQPIYHPKLLKNKV